MPDLSYADALSYSRQWGAFVRSFAKLDEVLAKCASAEQYLAEIQTRIDAAVAAEAEANAHAATATEAANAVLAKIADDAEAARKAAADNIAALNAAGAKDLAAARADALNAQLAERDAIEKAAKIDANCKLSVEQATAKVAEAQAQLDAIRAAIAAATKV